MKCFEDTGCDARESFWCGSNWLEAAETCTKPCSTGSSLECDAGQSCFAHTGCKTNMFYCGSSQEDAKAKCSEPCPSRSSDECGPGEYCFAFLDDCADDEPQGSGVEDPQTISMGIANTDFNYGDYGGPGGSTPSWEVGWINNMNDSSSVTTLISCVLGSITLVLGVLMEGL